MNFRIIPRSEWGARHANGFGPARLPAIEVWLHHSVTVAPDIVAPFDDDYAAIRTLESIGQSRFGRGISYTWPITPAGLIFEGHSVDRQGSHTGGRNHIARAICFVGNYDVAEPTSEQLQAAAWLLGHAHQQGWIDAPRLDGGHRDLKQTACPGRHAYARIGRINELAATAPAPAPAPQEDDMDLRIPLTPLADPTAKGFGALRLPGEARDSTPGRAGSKVLLTTGWGQRFDVRVWFLGRGDKKFLGSAGGRGYQWTVTSDNPGEAPIPDGTVAVHAEWTSTDPLHPGDLRVVFVPL